MLGGIDYSYSYLLITIAVESTPPVTLIAMCVSLPALCLSANP
jgi:hypothetical protein